MKEFNLEAAKNGASVCTRDGRKARIICFDKNDDIYPILALIEENFKGTIYEVVMGYTIDGKYIHGGYARQDLMMVDGEDIMMIGDADITQIGYINLYIDEVMNADGSHDFHISNKVYHTREAAEADYPKYSISNCVRYLKTI